MKNILDILTACLTPLIAIVTTYIAVQQYKVQRRQFRHELYERRLKVYRALTKLLWAIMRDARVDFPQIGEFSDATAEAIFLFDAETNDYLRSIQEKAINLRQLGNRLYPFNGQDGLPVGGERTKVVEQESKLLEWFSDQIKTSEQLFKTRMGMD